MNNLLSDRAQRYLNRKKNHENANKDSQKSRNDENKVPTKSGHTEDKPNYNKTVKCHSCTKLFPIEQMEEHLEECIEESPLGPSQYEKDLQKQMEKYEIGIQEAIAKQLPLPKPTDFGIPVDLNKRGEVSGANFPVDSLTPIFNFLS
ncbi:unnamed protein product [Caenorhabditis nigoni]